jgi:hypothetical protein
MRENEIKRLRERGERERRKRRRKRGRKPSEESSESRRFEEERREEEGREGFFFAIPLRPTPPLMYLAGVGNMIRPNPSLSE